MRHFSMVLAAFIPPVPAMPPKLLKRMERFAEWDWLCAGFYVVTLFVAVGLIRYRPPNPRRG